MFESTKRISRRLLQVMFCHHCLYGMLALLYVTGGFQLLDKTVIAQAAAAIYLALAVRG